MFGPRKATAQELDSMDVVRLKEYARDLQRVASSMGAEVRGSAARVVSAMDQDQLPTSEDLAVCLLGLLQVRAEEKEKAGAPRETPESPKIVSDVRGKRGVRPVKVAPAEAKPSWKIPLAEQKQHLSRGVSPGIPRGFSRAPMDAQEKQVVAKIGAAFGERGDLYSDGRIKVFVLDSKEGG